LFSLVHIASSTVTTHHVNNYQ